MRFQRPQILPASESFDTSRCSLCAYKPNDPVSCGQKAHAFSAQRAFFIATPGLARGQKACCSPCAYNPNDPVSCGQKAHAFFAQPAFSSDPGSCPRSETRCSPCANKNKTTNQQSTTNNKYYSQIFTYPAPFSSPLLPGIALKAPFSPSHRSLAGTIPHHHNFKAHTAKELQHDGEKRTYPMRPASPSCNIQG